MLKPQMIRSGSGGDRRVGFNAIPMVFHVSSETGFELGRRSPRIVQSSSVAQQRAAVGPRQQGRKWRGQKRLQPVYILLAAACYWLPALTCSRGIIFATIRDGFSLLGVPFMGVEAASRNRFRVRCRQRPCQQQRAHGSDRQLKIAKL